MYTLYAPFYDLEVAALGFSEESDMRRDAVAALDLKHGARVLDVGCGTGLNFHLIEKAIGIDGQLVGVDMTKAMIDRARKRCEGRHWGNVTLVCKDVMKYKSDKLFDAVICTFALESMADSRKAIDHILKLLKPGGRLCIVGAKLTSKMPLGIVNIPYLFLCKAGGLDLDKNGGINPYILSLCRKIEYREFWGGLCYILSTVRPK